MVKLRINVLTNGDDAFVSWVPSGFIKGCRGFLIERKRKVGSAERVEVLENRVGFADNRARSGEHRPSSEWPFQRFNWIDHAVNVGQKVKYRVTAMIDSGSGRPFRAGPSSPWTKWAHLTPDCGHGFSAYFNRGLILSQFVARYMKAKKLRAGQLKRSLVQSLDPKFRTFLEGDLGRQLRALLEDTADSGSIYAALYELHEPSLEDALIRLGSRAHVVLANGSDKSGDGNSEARERLNDEGVTTIDRLLRSKGLGHNKFVVFSKAGRPHSVWTGSTNWATTGLCTQVNNGLLIEHSGVAKVYKKQWQRLRDASPPITDPAAFPETLVTSNDAPTTVTVGKVKTSVWFARTSTGADMDALNDLIKGAQEAVLFLMFAPGKSGLHLAAGRRATEKGMLVRGVVSTLGNEKGNSDLNVLDVKLIGSASKAMRDQYSVVQPQGAMGMASWIAEVTHRQFLTSVGHAIVHSKILVIDPLSAHPVVVTGSHNFSASASRKNDENFVIVRDHPQLARAYATHVMSVYQHYRYRSYVREMLAEGKKPWNKLEDNDTWLKHQLKSKATELNYWAR